MRLYVGGSYAESQIEDGEQLLEEKLNKVFETVYRKIASQHERKRQHELQRQIWATEEKQRERLRAEQRQLGLCRVNSFAARFRVRFQLKL